MIALVHRSIEEIVRLAPESEGIRVFDVKNNFNDDDDEEEKRRGSK